MFPCSCNVFHHDAFYYQGVRIQDLTLSHGAQPVKHGHMLVGEALL